MTNPNVIIAVVNQKGGTGKTTTTVNLGAALAHLGKKVLMVDMDPQGNLTFNFGIHNRYDYSLLHVLAGEATIQETIKEQELLHIVPADIHLASLEVSLAAQGNSEFLLKGVLSEVKHSYDYILLDCAPSLSILTINALTAADKVIVPLQLEVLSLHGLSLIVDTIFDVKETYNDNLSILGILPVMVDYRRRVTGEIYDYLNENFGFRIMENKVGIDVRIVESPSFGKSVIEYAPKSLGSESYLKLAQEVELLLNHNQN
ncbi:AAA family ATPase [Limibacter armeniacum]|uniref:ParA family protein n=1 Tax=Limibacter armeniacum TaxID=466084 RepID=UPI002FE567A8